MCFKEINEFNFSDYLYSIKNARTFQKMLKSLGPIDRKFHGHG